jgi:hypothetical protein
MDSRGWGDAGHRIIGEIAWRQLSNRAKAEVAGLLAGEPARFRRLSGASTWADAIRSDVQYDWAKPHHYVNIRKGEWTYREERDCGSRGCLVSALRRHRAVLEDRSASRGKRAEALKFYAHFIGDLHQPLHVGNREDRGGNEIQVVVPRWWLLPPDGSHLHREWDTTLVEQSGPQGERRAADLLRKASRAEWVRWGQGSEIDWVNDSRAVFMRLGLADTRAGARIDRAYVRSHRDLVNEQLLKAGVRLAAALNQVFAESRN